MKPLKDFRDVLLNSADQVIVRELLNEYVPGHVKQTILSEFNSRMKRRNRTDKPVNSSNGRIDAL